MAHEASGCFLAFNWLQLLKFEGRIFHTKCSILKLIQLNENIKWTCHENVLLDEIFSQLHKDKNDKKTA